MSINCRLQGITCALCSYEQAIEMTDVKKHEHFLRKWVSKIFDTKS